MHGVGHLDPKVPSISSIKDNCVILYLSKLKLSYYF